MLFIFCITRHARSIINTWIFVEMSMSFLLYTNFLDFKNYIFLVNNQTHQHLLWIYNILIYHKDKTDNLKIYATLSEALFTFEKSIKAIFISNIFINVTKKCHLVNFNRWVNCFRCDEDEIEWLVTLFHPPQMFFNHVYTKSC